MSLGFYLGGVYRFVLRGAQYPLMVIRKSRASSSARVGRGCILVRSEIGAHSYLGEGVYLNHTRVGNYCSIAAGAKIGGMEHSWWWGSTSPRLSSYCIMDRVTSIGDDVWMGANVVVRQGVSIGRGAVIGAGSVVLKDVSPYSMVVGVPAREIRKRFPDEVIQSIEATRFWELPPKLARRMLEGLEYPGFPAGSFETGLTATPRGRNGSGAEGSGGRSPVIESVSQAATSILSDRSPTVSVIMPTYNAGHFVEAAIRSALSQSYPDLELVVVDDASKDETPTIVANLAEGDPRIVFERSGTNRGAAATRNRALSLSRGRYLAFLDSDDLWDANKLERQLAFMNSQGAHFSFTGYRVISAQGEVVDHLTRMPARMNYADLLKDTVIACSTVVLDREQVGDVRFPDLRTSQDLALWLSLLKAGHAAFGIGEALASYRIAPQSLTRNKRKAAMQVWGIYRQHERLPFLKALWYFSNYGVRGLRKHLRAKPG